MRATIQRVESAEVETGGKIVGKINEGILVLIGIEKKDNFKTIKLMANKILNLRIFNDEQEKMNYSLLDIKGDMLIVSQFTLYGECRKGNRPSFINAASPNHANKVYNDFVNYVKREALSVQTGKFGSAMKVKLINDGPVTFNLEIKL